MGILEMFTQAGETFDLVMLGFRIVMLIFLVGWVRGHLGGGLVATIVTLIVGWLVLFEYFFLFGPMFLFYLLLLFGGINVIQDLAFGKEHYLPSGHGEMEGMPAMRGR